jgi:hypothetical protein
VCTPKIELDNRSANGNGKLFSDNYPDATTFLQGAALTDCNILYRQPSEVPDVPSIKFVVEDMDGVAYTSGQEVHLSSTYLHDYSGSDLKAEISGVVHHEFTHVYQNFMAPTWLIEGIADFVRFRAGEIPISNRQPGGHYDDAYQTTAFFLAWIDDAHKDFVYQLNQKVKTTQFTNQMFVDLAGQDVDTLWNTYQKQISP